MSCFYLHVECTLESQEPRYCVKVYMLQDGCWHETFHIFEMSQLPTPRCEPKAVLVDNKIYLPAGVTASSVSTI
jgi:hypothetical protein